MNAIRLPDGNLLVPSRAAQRGVLGDGAIEVRPGTPEYEAWLPFAVTAEENRARRLSEGERRRLAAVDAGDASDVDADIEAAAVAPGARTAG
jgi:hypothetical protein